MILGIEISSLKFLFLFQLKGKKNWCICRSMFWSLLEVFISVKRAEDMSVLYLFCRHSAHKFSRDYSCWPGVAWAQFQPIRLSFWPIWCQMPAVALELDLRGESRLLWGLCNKVFLLKIVKKDYFTPNWADSANFLDRKKKTWVVI